MKHSIKECQCGRRIPNDWRVCGVCEQMARLDALDGSAEYRLFRYQALKQAGWPNRDVEPPVPPEVLAQMADGISKRAQEQSLLGIRHLGRTFQDLKLRLKD